MRLNDFLKKRHLLLFIVAAFFSVHLYSQVPSVIEKIRMSLWAEMEAVPGFFEDSEDFEGTANPSLKNDNIFDFAVSHIKKISPFFMEGIVYGWDFVYTPSDNARNVSEYFELIPKVHYSYFDDKIDYVYPLVEDNKLNCWCEYSRTTDEVQNYYWWNSINNPRIHGNGYGALSKGFEGIKDAVVEAAKNAIREYYRGILKNKPKEITGAICMKNVPLIGLDAGRYFVKLDFLLEFGKIVDYVQF